MVTTHTCSEIQIEPHPHADKSTRCAESQNVDYRYTFASNLRLKVDRRGVSSISYLRLRAARRSHGEGRLICRAELSLRPKSVWRPAPRFQLWCPRFLSRPVANERG